MWNINLKRGTVWSTKSLNEYDDVYEGMTFGSMNVLLLSVYTDMEGNKIYTYLKVCDSKRKNRVYTEIKLNGNIKYIELNELQTGDQRSLQSYQGTISLEDLNIVIKSAKYHFNLFSQKEKVVEPVKVEQNIINENCQQKIYKFGIDIYVNESEDVKISKSKKLILSDKCKDDIIYNSKTDEDIRVLSDKYHIYPMKAIKEIRNRLVYQHKQKQG